MPQIANLPGHSCWHRHAERLSLHVLVSVSAAHDICEGDPAVRILRSLRSLRARCRLPPTATAVPQIANLPGRGCWHRHADRLSPHVLVSLTDQCPAAPAMVPCSA